MEELRRMEEKRDWHNPHWLPPIITKCTSVMGLNITTIATHMLGFILLLVFCHFAYMSLRKFSQPRVVSEFIVSPPHPFSIHICIMHYACNYFGLRFVTGFSICNDDFLLIKLKVTIIWWFILKNFFFLISNSNK